MADRLMKKIGIVVTRAHILPQKTQIVVYCASCDERFKVSDVHRHWTIYSEQMGGLRQTCHSCNREMNRDATIPAVLIPEHMLATCALNLEDMLDEEFKL